MSMEPFSNCWGSSVNTTYNRALPSRAEAIAGLKGVRKVDTSGDSVSITTGTDKQAKLLKAVLEPKIDGQFVKLSSQRHSEAASAFKPSEVLATLEGLTGGTADLELNSSSVPKGYHLEVARDAGKWANGLIANKIGDLPVHIQANQPIPQFDVASEQW